MKQILFPSFAFILAIILILYTAPSSAEKWLSYNTGYNKRDLEITDISIDSAQQVYCSAKSGIFILKGKAFSRIYLGTKGLDKQRYEDDSLYENEYDEDKFDDDNFDKNNNIVEDNTDFLCVEPLTTKKTLDIDKSLGLWIGTNTGLYKLKNETLKRFTPENCDLPDSTILTLQNMDRSVWVGTQKGLGQSFGEFQFRSFDSSKGLPGNQINDLCVHNEELWVAMTGGVASISSGGAVTSWPLDLMNGANVWATSICPVIDELNTWFAIGFAGSGVSFLENGKYTKLNIPSPGLVSTWVTAIQFIEDKKDLWIGTKEGLARYNIEKNTLRLYSSGSLGVLKSDSITCLKAQKGIIPGYEYLGEKNSLWIGTLNGGVYRWLDVNDKKETGQTTPWTTFFIDEDHEEYHNIASLDTHGEKLYALMFSMPKTGGAPKNVSGNYNKSLKGSGKFIKCSFRGVKSTPSTLPALFTAMEPSNDGTAWLGGKWSIVQEMLIHVDENNMILEYFNQENTKFKLYDLDIAVLNDELGKLHILTKANQDPCTYFTYKPDEGFKCVTRLGYAKKRGDHRFFCDYEPSEMLIAGKNIWITTLGGGVIRYDGINWHEYTSMSTSGGLMDDKVFCVASGPEGDMWFGTKDGASRFKDDKWTQFTTKQGLPGSSVKDILYDAQNPEIDPCIWFATNEGVCQWIPSYKTATKYIWKKNEERSNGPDISLCAEGVNSICITGDFIWFGTTNGVSRFDRSFRPSTEEE